MESGELELSLLMLYRALTMLEQLSCINNVGAVGDLGQTGVESRLGNDLCVLLIMLYYVLTMLELVKSEMVRFGQRKTGDIRIA